MFTDILTVFEDHYPETLKKAIVINGKRNSLSHNEEKEKILVVGDDLKEDQFTEIIVRKVLKISIRSNNKRKEKKTV